MTSWANDAEDLTTLAMDAARVHSVRLRDGRDLTYACYGEPDGVPVIELHGGGASHLSGLTYHREALSAGVRVIAVNRPGAAGSTMYDGFNVADFPRDLDELADQLGLEQFVVMGNSNGGMFALSTGHALPDRVVGVLALNPATPVFDDPLALELTPIYNEVIAIGAETYAAGVRAQVDAGLLDHTILTAPPLFAATESTEAEVLDVYLRAVLLTQPAALDCEVGFLLRSWGFDIFDIEPPVLFLSGQTEVGTPYNRSWAARLPNAEVEEPPGGHLSHLAPDQRARLMAKVVAWHSPS